MERTYDLKSCLEITTRGRDFNLLLDSENSNSIRIAMLENPQKYTWFLTTPAGMNFGVFEVKRLFLAIAPTDFLETKTIRICKHTLMLNETHLKN